MTPNTGSNDQAVDADALSSLMEKVYDRNDEYYGSGPMQEACETLYALYEQQGYGKAKIDKLLVLDIKEHEQ